MREEIAQQPAIATIFFLAVLMVLFHIGHLWLRPGRLVLTSRISGIVGAVTGVVYGNMLFREKQTPYGESVSEIMLDLPPIVLYMSFCYLTARSICRASPVMRWSLLSSLIVLPVVWLTALYVGLQWPIAELSDRLAQAALMPSHYALYKITVFFAGSYLALISILCFREVLKPVIPILRRRIQMLSVGLAMLALAVAEWNAGLTAVVQTLFANATSALGVLKITQAGLCVAIVIFLSTGMLLHAYKSERDRAINLAVKWVGFRRQTEAHLLRTHAKSPASKITVEYLDRTTGPVKEGGMGLDEEQRKKARTTLKLALLVCRNSEVKKLAQGLKSIQREISKDPHLLETLRVDAAEDANYNLVQDTLYECIQPALELSQSQKAPQNFHGRPEWQQLAAAAFADAASEMDLIDARVAKHLQERLVSGTIVGFHLDTKSYLSDQKLR